MVTSDSMLITSCSSCSFCALVVMRVVRQKRRCKVRVADMEVERVNEIKYLGVMTSSFGNSNMEKEVRIGSAVRIIGGMSEAVLCGRTE